jgi:hypothetical protein
MPRFPKLFGRKGTEEDDNQPAPPQGGTPTAPPAARSLAPGEIALDAQEVAASSFAPVGDLDETGEGAFMDEDDVPDQGGGSPLIGGEEEDLVPVIPDSDLESGVQDAAPDDESSANATVDALMAASKLMVGRVNAIRRLPDGGQIVAGLIALAIELDTQYAQDSGIVRRNGLEDVLVEVRETAVEGDRFILESLENGRGGLTAEVFLRDLRTIAPGDRARMIANYVTFLVFVITCVLRQYLRPLAQDPAQLRDVTRRLDYLMDGVRDALLTRVSNAA